MREVSGEVVGTGSIVYGDSHRPLTSVSLRAILRYGAEHHARVRFVEIVESPDGGARVCVSWNDGSIAYGAFADFTVAKHWVLARRSWKGAEVFVAAKRDGMYQTIQRFTL